MRTGWVSISDCWSLRWRWYWCWATSALGDRMQCEAITFFTGSLCSCWITLGSLKIVCVCSAISRWSLWIHFFVDGHFHSLSIVSCVCFPHSQCLFAKSSLSNVERGGWRSWGRHTPDKLPGPQFHPYHLQISVRHCISDHVCRWAHCTSAHQRKSVSVAAGFI